MSGTPRVQQSFRKGLAAYGKVMLLQTVVVASFSFWLLKEYQNNAYLREYVQGKIPTYLSVFALAGALSLILAGVGVYSWSQRRTLEKRVARAPSLVPMSPMIGAAVKDAAMIARASFESGHLLSPSAHSFSPASLEEAVDPPVLRHVELPPGFGHGPPGPKPFPVVIRIMPPEETVEDERTEAPQAILKRVAPRQPPNAPPSTLGAVRRVGLDTKSSGRSSFWKNHSGEAETVLEPGQKMSVLENVSPPGREERLPGLDGKTGKKRPPPKRPGSGPSSRSETA